MKVQKGQSIGLVHSVTKSSKKIFKMITLLGWRHPTVTFIIGVVIGTVFYLIGSKNNHAVSVRGNMFKYMKIVLDDNRYTPSPSTPNYKLSDEQEESSTQDIGFLSQTEAPISADELAVTVRVLCFIVTTPKNHWVRAIHVKKTWGRRCNKLIFMSTKADYILGAIKLNVTEGYDYLWSKSKKSLEHIYENYLDQYDWFLKADDDTYVIMENLRNLLKDYNTDEGHFFGCNFQPSSTINYMSGGAGYVLSRKAVIKFVEEALPDGKKCSPKEVGYEDVEMGKCLKNVGVIADDSRDEFKRHRFLALPPKHYLIPGSLPKGFWWWQYIKYPQGKGMNCCSHTGISFHYITPNDMYLFEFFLYQLRVIGITKTEKPLVRTTVASVDIIEDEIQAGSTSTQTPHIIDGPTSDSDPSTPKSILSSTSSSPISEEQDDSTESETDDEEITTTAPPKPKKKKKKQKKKSGKSKHKSKKSTKKSKKKKSKGN